MPMVSMRWAAQEFGQARLGDARRTRRLVSMGAQALATPGGKLTEVFSESAEREGAYRFVENEDIEVQEIADAAHRATVRRCFGAPLAWVPIDQTSLNLTDDKRQKGLGAVGTHQKGARG